jgi:Tfp pilus assembly protein PilX
MFKKRKSKLNENQKEEGSALVLAIIVLVNALFIVVTVSSIAIVERQMSSKNRSSTLAFQAADSGIEYILGIVKESSDQEISSLCQAFSNGECVIDPEKFGNLDLSVKIYFLDGDGNVIEDENTKLSDVESARSVGTSGEGSFETTRAVEINLKDPAE